MNIISTKKLLISLILVMGIMMIGGTSEVKAADWLEKEYIELQLGRTSKRYEPIDNGEVALYSILLHKLQDNTVIEEKLSKEYTYNNGKTYSFLNKNLIVKITEENSREGFTVYVSDTMEVGMKYRLELKLDHKKSGGSTWKTYKKNYDITIKKPGTVTFKGGAEGVTNIPNSLTAGADGKVTIPSEPPVRVGYTFKQWVYYYNGRASSTYASPGDTITVNNYDYVLVAQWTKNPAKIHDGENNKFEGKAEEPISFRVTEFYEEQVKGNAIFSEYKGNGDIGSVCSRKDFTIKEVSRKEENGAKWIYYTFTANNEGNYFMIFTDKNQTNKYVYQFIVGPKGNTTTPPAGDNIVDPMEELDNVDAINTENMEEINKTGSAKEKTAIYDKDGNVIGNIESGTQITVLEKTSDGKYYKIKWKETDVYAHQNWVDASNKKAIKTNSSYGPNIRTSAGSGTVLGDLVDGQPFTSVENGSGKYKKVSFEIEGYVKIGAIDVDASSVNPPDAGTENSGTDQENTSTGNSLLDLLLGTVKEGISLGMKLFEGLATGNGTGGLLQTLAGTLTGVINGGSKQEGTSTGSSLLRNGLNFMVTVGKGMNKIGEMLGTRIEDSSGNTLTEAVSGAFLFVNLIDVLTSNVGG